MKAYFSVIGIGLGHAARCISIAKNLRERGVECVFSSYGKAAKIISNEGFRTYESKPLMWYENGNGHLDYEKTLLKSPLIFFRMTRHYRDERDRVQKEDPDVVITDSRYSIIPASKDIDAPRLFITNQPRVYMPSPENGDYIHNTPLEKLGNWWNYNLLSGQDKILLPDFPMPESISYRHMLFDDAPEEFKRKAEFVGPIAPHRPNGTNGKKVREACEKYGVEPGNFIYIAFSGPGSVKKEVHDAIFDLFPDYEIPVLMGTGKPGGFKLHEKGNLKLVDGWINERESLLKGAKLVISRAGLCTLSEIAAFGKNAVVIPQPNQPEQESNARGVQKMGFAKKIGPCTINGEKLDRAIKYLLNSEEAKQAAKDAQKMTQRYVGEKKSSDIIMRYMNGNS